jgi:hypothetical protein
MFPSDDSPLSAKETNFGAIASKSGMKTALNATFNLQRLKRIFGRWDPGVPSKFGCALDPHFFIE